MSNDPDHKLLQALTATQKVVRDKAMRQLYEDNYPLIRRFITSNNGTLADAADIFQDAMVVFYTQLQSGQLDLQCSIQTYLYAIARNLWLKRLRREQRTVAISDDYDTIDISDNQMKLLMHGERSKIIIQLINRLGNNCQKILTLFYFEHLRIQQIQQQMGYSSVQVAKNKKSRCMKQLREMAKDDTQFNELIA
jgi:RNA polymerase sigma factor (sigma-70 family)